MWTLNEGIGIARIIEPIAKARGYHVALGGGVLHNGSSDKDLDLVFYERGQFDDESRPSPEEFVTSLTEIGFDVGIKVIAEDQSGSAEGRTVIKTLYHNKRVDFIFC